MINAVRRKVMSYLAQHTTLFDLSSVDMIARTQSNLIRIDGLNGEYTLSVGKDGKLPLDVPSSILTNGYKGIASNGCLFTTHDFVNGVCESDCFFGNEVDSHSVMVRTLNVGTAFKKDVAMEAVRTDESGNMIVVYMGETKNTRTVNKYSDSMDKSIKTDRTLGVMFKVYAEQIDALGCTEYDKLFINSVVGASQQGTSLVGFEAIADRFYSGKFYVVDMSFSYTDEMFLTKEFLDKVKNFEAIVDSPII